jgi:hypothetical protein
MRIDARLMKATSLADTFNRKSRSSGISEIAPQLDMSRHGKTDANDPKRSSGLNVMETVSESHRNEAFQWKRFPTTAGDPEIAGSTSAGS